MKGKLLFLLIPGCLLLPSLSAKTPPARVARLEIANLEAQVSTKEKLVERSWDELRRLNALLVEKGVAALDIPEGIPGESSGRERVEGLMTLALELESLERQRLGVLQNLRSLYEEIRFLRQEIRRVREEWPESSMLEGWWTLILLPDETRGEVYFVQDKASVSGEYRLQGGLTGNLTGNYIDRKLTVERLDSLHGQMGRLEGELMGDGNRIQGTWYSYEVMSGRPLVGPFILTRDREDVEP